MICDSVLFDLDGTLWDGTNVITGAYNDYLSTHPVRGPFTTEELQSVFGLQIDEISEIFFPGMPAEERMKLMLGACEHELEFIRKEGGILYEGLEETLGILSKKYPLIIVSNCQKGYIEAFLDHHQLGRFFSDTECAGNTGLSKGENIQLVMNRNHLKNPVYVGDTVMDGNAAREAGVPFIFASYGFGETKDYDASITTFPELLQLLSLKKN